MTTIVDQVRGKVAQVDPYLQAVGEREEAKELGRGSENVLEVSPLPAHRLSPRSLRLELEGSRDVIAEQVGLETTPMLWEEREKEGEEGREEGVGWEEGMDVPSVESEDDGPFVCEGCGQSFTQDYALRQHLAFTGRCDRRKKMKTEDLSCPRCLQTFLHKSSWKYHVDHSINCVAKKSKKEKQLAGPGPDLLPAADVELLPELEEIVVFAGCLEDSEPPSLPQPCSATGFCSRLPEPSETRLQELKEVWMRTRDLTDSQRGFDVEKQVGEGSKQIDHREPPRAGVVS